MAAFLSALFLESSPRHPSYPSDECESGAKKGFSCVQEIDCASKGDVTSWESRAGETQVTRNNLKSCFSGSPVIKPIPKCCKQLIIIA